MLALCIQTWAFGTTKMARERTETEESAGIVIPRLADDLKIAAGLSKPAATKVAEASRRAIKKMKPGQIVVLNIEDARNPDPVVAFEDIRPASLNVPISKSVFERSPGSWQTRITWISGKKGKPFGVIASKSRKPQERVIIVGAISPAELPTSGSFRTFADDAVRMLSDEGFSANEIYQLRGPETYIGSTPG